MLITLAVLPKFRATHGDSVTVSPIEALVLARRGVVNLSDRKTATLVADVPADVPKPPRRKRTYRRRDMTAETA